MGENGSDRVAGFEVLMVVTQHLTVSWSDQRTFTRIHDHSDNIFYVTLQAGYTAQRERRAVSGVCLQLYVIATKQHKTVDNSTPTHMFKIHKRCNVHMYRAV